MEQIELEQPTTEKWWIMLQASSIIIGITILLFTTILVGGKVSAGEINLAILVATLILVVMTILIVFRQLRLDKRVAIIFSSLVVALLGLISLAVLSDDAYLVTMTGFTLNTVLYIILGLVALIAIIFTQRAKAPFITWAKTKLWRDLFFMAVAVLFVFVVTFLLSVMTSTPFETTTFLGVPFSAQAVDFQSDFTDSLVKGVAGFLESNFFFTVLLGLVSVVGVVGILPTDSWLKRLIVVSIISVIFGVLIAYLHTGLHDLTQEDVLFYIAIFFTAGAMTTLFWVTSFSFIMAHGLVDFMKAGLLTQNPQMTSLVWMLFLVIMAVGAFSFLMWRNDSSLKKLKRSF